MRPPSGGLLLYLGQHHPEHDPAGHVPPPTSRSKAFWAFSSARPSSITVQANQGPVASDSYRLWQAGRSYLHDLPRKWASFGLALCDQKGRPSDRFVETRSSRVVQPNPSARMAIQTRSFGNGIEPAGADRRWSDTNCCFLPAWRLKIGYVLFAGPRNPPRRTIRAVTCPIVEGDVLDLPTVFCATVQLDSWTRARRKSADLRITDWRARVKSPTAQLARVCKAAGPAPRRPNQETTSPGA